MRRSKWKWKDGPRPSCCGGAPSGAGTAAVTAAARPHRSIRPISVWCDAHRGSRGLTFTWRRSEITFLFLFFFFLNYCYFILKNGKKDNHPAVCMTQKHQLKTIPCITYYFMLGWNLSACINSLYKLRLVDWRRPLCVGTSVWLCF